MTVRSSIAHHTIPTRLVGKAVVLNATCVVGLVINNNDRLRSVIGHIRQWPYGSSVVSVGVRPRRRGTQVLVNLLCLSTQEVFRRRERSQLRRGPHAEWSLIREWTIPARKGVLQYPYIIQWPSAHSTAFLGRQSTRRWLLWRYNQFQEIQRKRVNNGCL